MVFSQGRRFLLAGGCIESVLLQGHIGILLGVPFNPQGFCKGSTKGSTRASRVSGCDMVRRV